MNSRDVDTKVYEQDEALSIRDQNELTRMLHKGY